MHPRLCGLLDAEGQGQVGEGGEGREGGREGGRWRGTEGGRESGSVAIIRWTMGKRHDGVCACVSE